MKLKINIVHSATLVIMRSLPVRSSCTQCQLAGIYELNIHVPIIEQGCAGMIWGHVRNSKVQGSDQVSHYWRILVILLQ